MEEARSAKVTEDVKALAEGILKIYAPFINKGHGHVPDSSGNARNVFQLTEDLKGLNRILEGRLIDCSQGTGSGEIEGTGDDKLKAFQPVTEKAKECEMALRNLKELAKHDKEKTRQAKLVEVYEKEKQIAKLQIEVAELETTIKLNNPEITEKLETTGKRLKQAVDKLQVECDHLNLRVEEYKSLGQEGEDCRKMYEKIEEDLKTKLWVKEQLISEKGTPTSNTSLNMSLELSFS